MPPPRFTQLCPTDQRALARAIRLLPLSQRCCLACLCLLLLRAGQRRPAGNVHGRRGRVLQVGTRGCRCCALGRCARLAGRQLEGAVLLRLLRLLRVRQRPLRGGVRRGAQLPHVLRLLRSKQLLRLLPLRLVGKRLRQLRVLHALRRRRHPGLRWWLVRWLLPPALTAARQRRLRCLLLLLCSQELLRLLPLGLVGQGLRKLRLLSALRMLLPPSAGIC